MKRFLLLALLPLVGCANTPEGQAQFRDNFFNGMAAQQQYRAYQQPAYQMPLHQPMRSTNCRRMSNGDVNCTTW